MSWLRLPHLGAEEPEEMERFLDRPMSYGIDLSTLVDEFTGTGK